MTDQSLSVTSEAASPGAVTDPAAAAPFDAERRATELAILDALRPDR